MTSKADFTQDEWAKLIESVMLASIAVTAAEPSGLWGTLHEGFSNAAALAGGRGSATPLIAAVVADLGTSEGRTIARDKVKQRLGGATSATDVVARSVAAVGEVAQVLDSKAGADAMAFKKWIFANAERVANASNEGGFLGFGGVKVSDKEKATLADLSKALGI